MNIDSYLCYDLPVPYKGLKIYPVTVKDYMMFNLYSKCLDLDKNTIPDVKIIAMTNLEYMFHSTREDMEKYPYLLWLDRLLGLCLKEDKTFENMEESIHRYLYDDNGKPTIKIGNTKYASSDFEEISNIIRQQNLIDLPDDNISKEVRDSLEQARAYKNKLSGSKPASLEDYIISMSVVTGWTIEYLYGMSIRKFTKSIRRMDNLIHYKIYLASSISGMVEFKDKSFIKHWLVNMDGDDKYDDVYMNLDEVKNKVSLESAK